MDSCNLSGSLDLTGLNNLSMISSKNTTIQSSTINSVIMGSNNIIADIGDCVFTTELRNMHHERQMKIMKLLNSFKDDEIEELKEKLKQYEDTTTN